MSTKGLVTGEDELSGSAGSGASCVRRPVLVLFFPEFFFSFFSLHTFYILADNAASPTLWLGSFEGFPESSLGQRLGVVFHRCILKVTTRSDCKTASVKTSCLTDEFGKKTRRSPENLKLARL